MIAGFCAFAGRTIPTKEYWLERIIRIYPLYWCAIFANVFIQCFYYKKMSFILHRLVISLLGLGMIVPSSDYQWNSMGATGSISTLIIFYLLVPLFRKNIDTFSKAVKVFIIIAVLSIGHKILLANLLQTIPFIDANGAISVPFYSPFSSLHYPVIGVALYFAKKEHKTLVFVVLSAIMIIISKVINESFLMWSFVTTFCLSLYWSLLGQYTLKANRVKYLLQVIIDYLDGISYTVWLTHPIVLLILIRVRHHIPTLPSVITTYGYMLIILGVATFVYQFYELPVQHYLRNKIKNRT